MKPSPFDLLDLFTSDMLFLSKKFSGIHSYMGKKHENHSLRENGVKWTTSRARRLIKPSPFDSLDFFTLGMLFLSKKFSGIHSYMGKKHENHNFSENGAKWT